MKRKKAKKTEELALAGLLGALAVLTYQIIRRDTF